MESSWKVPNVFDIHQHKDRTSIFGVQQPGLSLADDQSEVSTEKADWIVLDGQKVSVCCLEITSSIKIKVNDWLYQFLWLAKLSSNAKEDLWRSLAASNGRDVFVMGISYSDAQSLSTCRGFPKEGTYTMPRCRSYRLRKNHFLTDPRDTLSSIANRTTTDKTRTLYFSRVIGLLNLVNYRVI